VGIGIAVLVAVQAAAILVYKLRSAATETRATFPTETLATRAAPALAFERSDRSTSTLADLKGKVVLVHFWATWCAPCRDELPGLLALAHQLESPGGFELLAVSVDDDWEQIDRFFGGKPPRGAVRPDSDDVHRRFGASTLPDTYLIDARDNLVIRYAGARDWTRTAARRHLQDSIGLYRR